MNPEHLLAQADRMLLQSTKGPRRQADLRRALSSIYYAVFHYVLAATAEEFVGSNRRSTEQYALAYRSVDHRTLKEVSVEARKATPSSKYRRYVPDRSFYPGITEVASAVIELQDRRVRADYDPQARFRRADVELSLETARSAMARFRDGDREDRRMFLALLLFPPR